MSFEQQNLLIEHRLEYEKTVRNGAPMDHQDQLDNCPDPAVRAILKDELAEIDKSVSGGSVDRFTEFGPYRVIQPVADGHQSVVYKGVDLRTGEFVAIKEYFPRFRLQTGKDDPLLESKVLEDLDHPSIVRFIDSGVAEGKWYVVTEWLDGINVHEAMLCSPIPVLVALDIAIQVTDAIAASSRENIVHRDLKPSNIMILDGDMETAKVKVFDYGVAQASGHNDCPTETNIWKGTDTYSAPELNQDCRSDLFALGNVLKAMLESKYKSSVYFPPFLRKIVFKAIRSSPSQRYQSPKEMHADLESARRRVLSNRKVLKTPKHAILLNYAKALPTYRVGRAIILFFLGVLTAKLIFGVPKQVEPGLQPVVFTRFEDSVYRTGDLDAPEFIIKRDSHNQVVTPWSSYYTKNGHVRVALRTDSPGKATVSFFNLSMLREHPEPRHRISAGTSPVKHWLGPGVYLVVVEWDDGTFTEVVRAVPTFETDGSLKSVSPGGLKRTVDGIELAPVRRPARKYAKSVQSSNGLIYDKQLTTLSKPSRWPEVLYDLEQRGMRPPFPIEKKSINAGFTNELTLKFVGIDLFKSPGAYVNYSGKLRLDSEEPAGVTSFNPTVFSYRGICRTTPFNGHVAARASKQPVGQTLQSQSSQTQAP